MQHIVDVHCVLFWNKRSTMLTLKSSDVKDTADTSCWAMLYILYHCGAKLSMGVRRGG